MFITKLFKHKCAHVRKKLLSELGYVGCAVFVQLQVVHCNVCKAEDGTHFVRNLKSGLARRD